MNQQFENIERTIDERKEFIFSKFGDTLHNSNDLFSDKNIIRTLKETISNYVNGSFISTVMVAQILIELIIREKCFKAETILIDGLSFANLIKKVNEEGIITDDQFDVFDLLRKIRNPYVHPRNKKKEHLYVEINMHEHDANNALKAVYNIIYY